MIRSIRQLLDAHEPRKVPASFVRLNLESLPDRINPTDFYINTSADSADANVGNGEAKDAAGNTSLRAAIQEGNSLGGGHRVFFMPQNPPPGVPQPPQGRTIELATALPTLTANFEMQGMPFDYQRPTITRAANAANFGIIEIATGSTSSMRWIIITNGNSAVATSGGGVTNHGTLALAGCWVYANQGRNGGGIYSDGELSLVDSRVWGNSAETQGAGLYLSLGTANKAIISGTEINANESDGNGGGITATGGSLIINNSMIYANLAIDGFGGGIDASSDVSITNSSITQNFAEKNGGGLDLSGGKTTLTSCIIEHNESKASGGGWYANGVTLQMNGGTLSNNVASDGSNGGLMTGGTVLTWIDEPANHDTIVQM